MSFASFLAFSELSHELRDEFFVFERTRKEGMLEILGRGQKMAWYGIAYDGLG